MPLPLTVSCFSKIQIGFTFLVLAHPGSLGQSAVKQLNVCVCVCVHVRVRVGVCGCMSSYCITTAVLTRDCAGPPTPVPCRRTPSSPTTSPTGRCTSTGEAAAAPRWAGPRAAAPPPGGRWCEEGQCPGAGSGSWRRGLTSRAKFPSSRRLTDDCRTPTCVSAITAETLTIQDGGRRPF